ncbi:arylsulfatase A family protein [Catenovulum agarivorans DS-2]|uniref:Arylsulfatase A family protein n=1 Tax=Catenovulum agarivorans DS-2 TaxID=1328313 RepID=W7QS60_9ALTE|nr:sulfatase-like hydrolase/transferase [Catenovulum agarivorans]EWH08245.1 arylsulfatase A family protein [Catenovulum agarivorans DS-2]
MNITTRTTANIISLVLLTAHLLGCGSTNTVSTTNTAKPNIIFIYTDDQAPWALGFTKQSAAVTPNLDKLARQGMVFPNAYTTTPVCSPSRASLLTSKYGYELGIDDWINTIYPSLTRYEPELGLNPSEITWPELLQQQGYYNGLIGKWHIGYQPEHHPTQHGYQEFTGFVAGGTKTANPKLEINGQVKQQNGLTVDILTDHALEFLQNHQQKPFMLSLHYRAPHTAWLPVADEDMQPFEDLDIQIPNPNYPNLDIQRTKTMMKEYLASVHGIDRNIGRVLAKLDELKLADNTVVIFTSDHGYSMGHNGIWHKGNGHWLLKQDPPATDNIPKNQRPNLYDNSIKVPLLVRWPNRVAAGTTNLSSVSNLDWFPTLLDIANMPIPSYLNLRGNSFAAALFNAEKLTSTDYYAAYSTLHQSITGMRMYSDGNYKLIKDYINRGRDEFYNLTQDPQESTNLIHSGDPNIQRFINRFDNIIYKKMLATHDPLLSKVFGADNE